VSGFVRRERKARNRWIAAAAALACLLLLALPPAMGWARFNLDLGHLISGSGFLLTLLVLFMSVVPSVDSIAETASSAHYAQLDAMYQDILKTVFEKPYLADPAGLRPDQRPEYAVHAFIVWNFLETVRDRCAGDEGLQRIWGPVMASEYNIHREWFYRETVPYLAKPAPKFRVEFADFIWRTFRSAERDACGNALLADGEWIARPWHCRNPAEILGDPAMAPYLRPDAGAVSADP
jgi:hypothetical protein